MNASGIISSLQTERIEFPPETYLSAAQITTFYEKGYVIVKHAYTPAEVQEMAACVDRMLQRIAQEPLEATDNKKAAYIDGSQVVYTKGERLSIARVSGCGSMEPQLMEVLRSDKMVYTFLDLLNGDELEHLVCQFHPKLQGDGVFFRKHRDSDNRRLFDPDWQDIKGNGSYAVAIIAIDPMTQENGGLIIDKKSFPVPQAESEEVAVVMNPGDVLFMHPDILHWSGPNNSSQSRRTLLTGFCAAGANHKNYPGDCTNDLISVKDGRVVASAAPWKQLGDRNFNV